MKQNRTGKDLNKDAISKDIMAQINVNVLIGLI